jgi:hypothetical protein
LKLAVLQDNPAWDLEIVIPEKDGDMTYEVLESTVKPKIYKKQFVFNSNSKTIELILKYE